MAKWQTIIIEKIWLIGAMIIEEIDGIMDDTSEIIRAGADGFMDFCGGIISFYDRIADLISWGITYFGVHFLRRAHDLRISLLTYKRPIINGALYFVVTGVLATFLFAHAIDYSYTYNGRTLGIVKEQKDVLEILEMVSEELTQEYGLPIAIDPEQDITFKPVISTGKEIDNPDMVLRKFTYMGDIQTKAYSIFIDGQSIAYVQSEETGQNVIDKFIARFLKSNKGSYEYVGLTQDVKIREIDTSLGSISSESAVLKLVSQDTFKESKYSAKEGDTLEDVAKAMDVSVKDLKEMNPQLKDKESLEEGEVLSITRTEPMLSVKTIGKETFAEVLDYETEVIESDDYFEGEEFIKVYGSEGKQRVVARVTRINGEEVERENLETEIITEPVNKVIVKGTRKQPPRQGTGTFIRPVNCGIYSGFGWRWGRMHEGIDLATSTGTPIHAADGGTVTRAGWFSGYGLCVDIDHGGGCMTRYGHCSSINVSVGERVYQGQMIARVGSTGRSTGPHCHFEIRFNGKAVNPANYV